jgi:hypothetical protein
LIGFPSLKELVEREIARRQEGDSTWPTLCFIVDDKNPSALTNVEAAVKAIVEQAEQGNITDRVHITSDVHEAVLAALRAVYPRRLILVRTFADSPMRYAEKPEVAEGSAPSVAARIDDDAAARARDRLAKLRGEI